MFANLLDFSILPGGGNRGQWIVGKMELVQIGELTLCLYACLQLLHILHAYSIK